MHVMRCSLHGGCSKAVRLDMMRQAAALQEMVGRGAEGLLAVQRQVAAVQASSEEQVRRVHGSLRSSLQELHHSHHRHQDSLQVCTTCMLMLVPVIHTPECTNMTCSTSRATLL